MARGTASTAAGQFDERADGDARGRGDAAGLVLRRREWRQLTATGFNEIDQRGEGGARFCALRANSQLVALARPQAQDRVDATGRDVVKRHLRSIAAGQANELSGGARVEAETVGEGD